MIRSVAWIVVVILCLSACSVPYGHENYTGTVYFVTGQTLYAMNLRNLQVTPVYENQAIMMTSLEKLDDQHLLVGYESLSPLGNSEEQVVNRLNGSASEYGVNMQIESLRYLPKLKVMVFFGSAGAGQSSHWALYWVNAGTPFQPHLIEDAAGGSIIVISDHQIIYTLGTLGEGFRIKMYDFETHRSSLLNIADCNPILWRSRTDQLVCEGGNGAHSYYLTDLDGSDRQPVSFGWINAYMVAYIKKYDAAVMTDYGGISFSFTRGFYENSDLYLYEFQTKKLIHISDRYAANASPGAAVWYPDENKLAKDSVNQLWKYPSSANKK